MNDNERYIEEYVRDIPFEVGRPQHRNALKAQLLIAFPRNRFQSEAPRASMWRTMMRTPMSRLAVACVLVVGAIGIYCFFGGRQTSVYAKVVEAIENARTIHAVTTSLRDGQWCKDTEVWYAKGRGVVETSWRDGQKTLTRIDDGQYRWEFHAGDDYARRSHSIDPIGVAGKLLHVDSFKERAEREPACDKEIDAVRCIAYVLSNPQSSARILTWLDDADRIRSWEKQRLLDDGQWETYRVGEAAYDSPVAAVTFVPDFGENVKIIDLDTELDAYCDLDNALFVREELGLVFAIHALRKCQGDMIYVVSSIRPTENSYRAVKSTAASVWNYGDYQFGSSWKRLDDFGRGCSYVPIDLGEVYHAGVLVRWTLFFAEGFEPESPKECEFEVYLSTRGRLREMRTKEGLPVKQRFKSMAVLPLPEEQVLLSQVMEETYASLSALEPYAAHDRLTLKSVPFSDEEMAEYIKQHPDSGETRTYRAGDRSEKARLHHGQSSKPSEIDRDPWLQDRMEYIQEITENYEAFLEEVKRREQGG